MHREVHIASEVIWLHRATGDHRLVSPRSRDAASGDLAITTDDVEAHCEHARSARARIEGHPVERPYGRREYGAQDPEGHRWWFGSPLGQQDWPT